MVTALSSLTAVMSVGNNKIETRSLATLSVRSMSYSCGQPCYKTAYFINYLFIEKLCIINVKLSAYSYCYGKESNCWKFILTLEILQPCKKSPYLNFSGYLYIFDLYSLIFQRFMVSHIWWLYLIHGPGYGITLMNFKLNFKCDWNMFVYIFSLKCDCSGILFIPRQLCCLYICTILLWSNQFCFN